MSGCRWCDIGQHPFPEGQPGATKVAYEEQVGNQWGGRQPSNTVREACAACSIDSGMRNLRTDATQDEVDDLARSIREHTGGIHLGKRGGSVRALEGRVQAPGQPDKYVVDKEEYDRYLASLEKANGIAPDPEA